MSVELCLPCMCIIVTSTNELEQINNEKYCFNRSKVLYIYFLGSVVKISHLEVMVNDGLLWIYKNNFMANEI